MCADVLLLVATAAAAAAAVALLRRARRSSRAGTRQQLSGTACAWCDVVAIRGVQRKQPPLDCHATSVPGKVGSVND